MSFMQKRFNYYILGMQEAALLAYTPFAVMLGFDPSEDPSFSAMRDRILRCRRWTLDELNEWRLDMLSLATEAYDKAPGVGNGCWSDPLFSPLVTIFVTFYNFNDNLIAAPVTGLTVVSVPDPQPPSYTGNVVTTTTRKNSGPLLYGRVTTTSIGQQNSIALGKYVDAVEYATFDGLYENKLFVRASQKAVDILTNVMEAFPNLDVGHTLDSNKSWGAALDRLVYDGSIGEPDELEGCTRRYSAFGYYGTTFAFVPTLTKDQCVVHGILGAVVQERPSFVAESGERLAVVHVSRQSPNYAKPPYGVTSSSDASTNTSTAIKWQPSVSATAIKALTDAGCTVVLFRVSNVSGGAYVAYTSLNNAQALGITVTDIIEAGSHYVVRGTPGASFNPSTPGIYSLVVFGACKNIYDFGESYKDVTPQSVSIGSWTAATYVCSNGDRVEVVGYNRKVFITPTLRTIISFEHPGAALKEMLSNPCVSTADIYRTRYDRIVRNEKGANQLAYGQTFLLSDATVCGIGRYTACVRGVSDESLLYRYRLYTPHGNRLSVSDEGIYWVPLESGSAGPIRYVDGENQPHARNMSGIAAAGQSYFDLWRFFFSTDTTYVAAPYGMVINYQTNDLRAIPGVDIRAIDGFADMSTLYLASGWYTVVIPGAGRPGLSFSGTHEVIAHTPGKLLSSDYRIMPTKAGILGAPQVAYEETEASTNGLQLEESTITTATISVGVTQKIASDYRAGGALSYGTYVGTEGERSGLNPPKRKPTFGWACPTKATAYRANGITRYTAYQGQPTLLDYKNIVGLETYLVVSGYEDNLPINSNSGVEDLVWSTETGVFRDATFSYKTKWDFSFPRIENLTSGTYSEQSGASSSGGVRRLDTYQSLVAYESPVGVTLKDGVGVIGVYGPTQLSGSSSSLNAYNGIGRSGSEPMDLFPLTPVIDTQNIYGHGIPDLSLNNLFTHRLAVVGVRRKILHGVGDLAVCYNRCPERGKVEKIEGTYYYTPLSEGLDFIIGVPKLEESPPTIIVVRVLRSTTQASPDVQFTGASPPTQGTRHSLISPGKAFATTVVAGGVTEYTWKVGVDAVGSTIAAKYVEIGKYYARSFTVALPSSAVLSPLFVPSSSMTFDIEATLSATLPSVLTAIEQQIAAENIVLMVTVGASSTATRTPLAIVFPRIKEGNVAKIVYTLNKTVFSPEHTKLLAPQVSFRLVDRRSLASLAVTTFNHP